MKKNLKSKATRWPWRSPRLSSNGTRVWNVAPALPGSPGHVHKAPKPGWPSFQKWLRRGNLAFIHGKFSQLLLLLSENSIFSVARLPHDIILHSKALKILYLLVWFVIRPYYHQFISSCVRLEMRDYSRSKNRWIEFTNSLQCWLKTQHSENEDHGIWSHNFMENRWGNSGNSVRLYFGGAPKSLQPWN